MPTQKHVGKLFQAFDSDRIIGSGKRWLEIDSWSDRVLITVGRNVNEDKPEETIGVTLGEQEALEVFEAFKDAMRRAGYMV